MKKKLLYLFLLFFASAGTWSETAAQCTPGGPITTAANVSVCDGTMTVNIPITVSSFTNVGAISLKLTYDASKLGAADSLSKNASMTWSNFKINTSTSGIIVVSGFGTGITLTGTQTLFTVRFTKGTPLTSGSLSFYENLLGTSCEYAPNVPPDYTPFCDTPPETFYIGGGVTVEAPPISPVLSSATPAANSIICAGYNSGYATFTGGSGGGANEYQYSIDGGANWSAYINDALITTNGGTTSIKVRARRSGGSCTASDYNTYTIWSMASIPVAPALSVASPLDGTGICSETNAAGTVTGAAGSGGSTGSMDEYQCSTDGGTTWSSYTNGAVINTTTATSGVIVQSRRTAGDFGCSDSDWNTICTWLINERKSISGTFSYYNSGSDIPLIEQNITVNVYLSSDVPHSNSLGSDVTDGSGNYLITNLCPACNYDIVATSTHPTDFAVNTTDAAQVNYYGVNPYLIEKVRFHAGDVGVSGTPSSLTINATDAGRIQNNFVYGTAFDNNWTFWKKGDMITSATTTESYTSVTLSVGSNLDADMYGLCTGDFNRSFNPVTVKSTSSTLDLIYQGNVQMGANQEFDLPVQLVNASPVGAVSLILNLPADMVEVQDVIMNGAGGQLDWTVKGNELKIGWNSPVPLYIGSSSELLTLKLKTTSAFITGKSIRISLASNPLNELADEMYNVIGDAVLGIDVIEASTTGTPELSPTPYALSLSSYPNPFRNFTMITYSLPFEGTVTLEISNIMGNRVNTLINEVQAEGDYTLKLNTNNLPSGVYFAKLRLKSGNDELIRTIKLINNL